MGPNTAERGGYVIYRQRSNESSPKRLGRTTNAQFTDHQVVSAQYTYYVYTVDVLGNLSETPAEVTVQANRLRVWIPDVAGNPGEEVRIPINIGNARGLAPRSMIFDVGYDKNVLDFKRVESTILSRDVELLATDGETSLNLISINPDATGTTIIGEGRFLDLIFDIKGSAPGECIPIELNRATLMDAADNQMDTFKESGEMCVGGNLLWGDLNADGIVTEADA